MFQDSGIDLARSREARDISRSLLAIRFQLINGLKPSAAPLSLSTPIPLVLFGWCCRRPLLANCYNWEGPCMLKQAPESSVNTPGPFQAHESARFH